MVAQIDVKVELRAATDRVLASKSTKKLVVAGPGTGKTYLFRELLKSAPGTPEQRLVLTFINMLKHDLDRDLGDISRVFTLHGYCQHLLRHSEKLRNGMSASFRCYPGLRHLIPKDWVSIREAEAPHFVDLMRNLSCTNEQASFCLDRTNYYDAVDFDDSVYRTYQQLAEDPTLIPKYTLVLVDEFQDFNKMEASIIDLLAQQNSIVIVGDDDQALYSQLRRASWDHIRAHYMSGHYETFELPFCMRCPEVIVGAVNDIIANARADDKLNGRIPKPYRYYEPIKAEDSTNATAHEVAQVLALLWSGPETLIVISSDLSHYHSYETARRLDAATAAAIENGDWASLGPVQACGYLPIAGLLIEAKRRNLKARRLSLCSSGDTAGPRDQVVGYGAWMFSQECAMDS